MEAAVLTTVGDRKFARVSSDGIPIVKGAIIGKDVYVVCPYCAEVHVHGAPDSGDPGHREGHCSRISCEKHEEHWFTSSDDRRGYIIEAGLPTGGFGCKRCNKAVTVNTSFLEIMDQETGRYPKESALHGARIVLCHDRCMNGNDGEAYWIDLRDLVKKSGDWLFHLRSKRWYTLAHHDYLSALLIYLHRKKK